MTTSLLSDGGSLPSQMRCVEISRIGGPEVLKPVMRPLPEARPFDVLIRVAASGVNRPDCLQRKGVYPAPAEASPLPGLEVAGEIVALGAEADISHCGRHVCALVPGGGYAEYVRCPALHCFPVPQKLNPIESAALPEALFTVWHTLFERAGFAKGDTVLVHGGASGIGTTAIQLIRNFGGKAYVTCSEKKIKACESLGAERAFNYRDAGWASRLRGTIVNIVLDMVGGDYIQPNLDLLAVEGRYVLISFIKGPKARVDFSSLLRRRLSIFGSSLRPQSDSAKAQIAKSLRESVWPFLDSGQIRPVIDTVLPLDQAAKAHSVMEKGDHVGKIVLQTAVLA